MHVFQEYPLDLLEIDPFSQFDKDWGEVVTRTADKANAMTVSWGAMGTMWGQPAATLYIRESRFTRELLDQSERFSLCFLPDKYRKEMSFLGKASGRNENKIQEARLHINLLDEVPVLDEARLIFILRKMSKTPLTEDQILDPRLREKFYSGGNAGDIHNIYIAAVEKAYAR